MKKKYIEFPTAWEELQTEEWLYLNKCFCKMMQHKNIKLIDVKREFVRFVLKNRNLGKSGTIEYYHLVQRLVETLNWAFQEEDGKVSLDFNSTVNLLPKWENLVGPQSHGADLTFGEFTTAVMMMNAYTMTGNKIYLNYLAAVLYRKVKKGERIEFSQKLLNGDTIRTLKLPFYVLYAIYEWMASFSAFLVSGTFVIDGREVCFEELFETKKSEEDGGPKNLGMNSILMSVAESGVFGTAEQVEKTLLLRVMLKLLDDKYKSDELNKMMKKHDHK